MENTQSQIQTLKKEMTDGLDDSRSYLVLWIIFKKVRFYFEIDTQLNGNPRHPGKWNGYMIRIVNTTTDCLQLCNLDMKIFLSCVASYLLYLIKLVGRWVSTLMPEYSAKSRIKNAAH